MWRYRLLLALASPIVWAWLWLRGRKEPAYRQRWAERLGWVDVAPNPDYWIHAASFGEWVAAKPLVDALLLQGHKLLLTSFTATGSDYIQRQWPGRVEHAYLPLDWPGSATRFVRRVKPQRCLVLETEFWPNLIAACHKQAVPVALVSARLGAASIKQYQRLFTAAALNKLLASIRFFACQTSADAERFAALGAKPEQLFVTGNIKFDMALPPGFAEQVELLKSQLGSRPVLLAASTHADEEQIVLNVASALRKVVPQLLVVMAPRHPQRFDEVAELIRQQGWLYQRRSEGQTCRPQTEVYLADSLGELLSFYAVANVAFVGGSLAPIGGHNVLEPALTQTPIVVGPHLQEQPVALTLQQQGGLLLVEDEASLLAACQKLFGAPAQSRAMAAVAHEFLRDNQGALAQTLQRIHTL